MARRSPRSSPKGKSKEVSQRNGKDSTSSASWTTSDIEFLIDQVIARRAEGGDGMSFKKSFWQSLAASDRLSNPEKGGPKTSSSCKEKWSRLKKTFDVVDRLAHSSGFAFSLELGANIGIENESVWTDYLKHHPAASPFRNKGWAFYDKMKIVMPSKSKGTNRFSALSGPSVTSSSSKPAPPSSRSAATSDSENAERNTNTVATVESTDVVMELSTDSGLPHDALHPPSSEVSGGTSTRPLSSVYTCLTPSNFTPPAAPSSFTSSLASSIKPSSSISARAENSNKRKADDDDASMVSIMSPSVAGSSHSSAQRRCVATIPAAIDQVGDRLGSLNDTFRDSVAVVGSFTSNISAPLSRRLPPPNSVTADTESPKSEATSRLLALDLPTLSPPQTVAIIDCFQNNPDNAKMYLTLAANTSEPYAAIRKAWLTKRLEEAGIVDNRTQ